MPLDAVFLTALMGELGPRITGMKIDKVQQPERDIIILSLRGMGEGARLLISAGSGSARVHLTGAQFENPQNPPMFCMLLRKHLQGARIVRLRQPVLERVLILELESQDEMSEPARKALVIEMIGRSANILLLDQEGIIIDCLRRVNFDRGGSRQLLPGLIYRKPPGQAKQPITGTGEAVMAELWAAAPESCRADQWLLDTFFGLSPLICRELCFRAFGEASPRVAELTPGQRRTFPAMLAAFSDSVSAGEFLPCMLLEGAAPREFSFMPIKQYEPEYQTKICQSFSQLLDEYYTRQDQARLLERRSQQLRKIVKRALERTERKLILRQEELAETGKREMYRKRGDLITANIYRLSRGMEGFTAQDYFSEDLEEIKIPLDPLKSPQQNAAANYTLYNKAKTAERHLTERIRLGRRERQYLESVREALARVESQGDIDEIRGELAAAGYVKSKKAGKRERQRAPLPRRFVSSAGTEILVGRNNRQNDVLTFKTASKNDLWLHAQKIHGSHVIIRCGGAQPDEVTLREAASLAAYYSQAREAGKVPVDYTRARCVRKTGKALPGMVVYTDYKTISVQPDERLAERLKLKR